MCYQNKKMFLANTRILQYYVIQGTIYEEKRYTYIDPAFDDQYQFSIFFTLAHYYRAGTIRSKYQPITTKMHQTRGSVPELRINTVDTYD